MEEPNNYITATRKNFVSNDNEGRMVEKCIIEIQGTFLVKIRNDAFNRNDVENAYEHINKFLEIVGPIKINGLTQDRFRLSIFLVSLVRAAYEWFTKECISSITTWDNMLEKFILKFHHLSDHNEEETEEDDNPIEMNNVLEILRIEGNLFDFETSLCEAYHEFCRLLKINIDMFTYDIQNFKTYDEYKQELNDDEAKGTEKPWSENGVPYQLYHKWYDELADGKLKYETLALRAKIEGSWGDATPGVVKFCKWLKSCLENFHELEYKVLIKRFETTKYSFNDDEEYITIKESEYLNHSKDSLDAYRELLHLINEGWVVTTLEEKEKERKKEQYGDLAETMIWFKKSKGYHAVPPPFIENFKLARDDLSFDGLDDSVYKSNDSFEDWEYDSEDENVFESKEVKKTVKSNFGKIEFVNARNSTVEKPRKLSQNPRDIKRNRNSFEFTKKACFVCWSFNHLIKDCDFHDKKMVQKPVLKIEMERQGQLEQAVLAKSGIVSISAARQNSSRAAPPASTARPIDTAAPKPFMNIARLRPNDFHKSHSPSRTPFNQQTALKNRNLNDKVNTAKVNSVNTAKGNKVTSAAGEQGINAIKSSACWI
ncbi:hypothetical protein Tco_0702047 [Tanacetum coccineum]|uniref:Retrotransposon gag domain-containing protein n=1 Tax=Tanacetum coccineum TaxID=301880 RepID=A0ABQ4XVJ0_9ASTR